MLKYLKNKIKFYSLQKLWRKNNKHNFTTIRNIFDISKVAVGNGTYGVLEVRTWNNNNEYLQIGNYCSIAKGVKFNLGGNHDYSRLSTFPFELKYLNIEMETVTKGKIVVEDDVWIGMDVLILSGVTIGQGAVVGAGTVVTKDIPAYAIVGGNPMQIIKYRFSNELIEIIKDSKLFKRITVQFIKENIDILSQNPTIENVKKIIHLLE